MNVIFINSHPIQYFVPLYEFLNKEGITTTCWYCSDENIRGHKDHQFNRVVKWDIPLLEGYSSRFFTNYALRPSLYNGFFGLFNPGMIWTLCKQPKSIVIVHGWAYLTNILVLLLGRIIGHVICLRAETPLNQEMIRSKSNQFLKRIFLRGLLFPLINKLLYIGSQNKLFYSHFGVADRKLLFAPYAVDNARFRKAADQLSPYRDQLRLDLGLPVQGKIILFAAKYIEKKRPLDLLAAFEKLSLEGKCLVMVGEGELRKEMELFIADRQLENVFLTGFKNQTEIVKYYAVADVFVLCSGAGETWGLSVNEAMNFDLPLVVSEISGCSTDLVSVGRNGFVFKQGDIVDLANKLRLALSLDGTTGREIIDTFSFKTIAGSIRELQKR